MEIRAGIRDVGSRRALHTFPLQSLQSREISPDVGKKGLLCVCVLDESSQTQTLETLGGISATPDFRAADSSRPRGRR
jgi:hypothetical protein